ncbi:MAG: galactose ABC transporter substrate-binding protein, partial [Clostridia bacterium]
MNVTKLGAVMLAACLLCAAPAMASELNIGLCIYDGTDTFMSSMRNQIEQNAQGVINLTVYNSKNDQNLQNDQVEQLLTSGVDAMILNPVDRTAAGYLIEKAKALQVPVVFINREPLWEDIQLYDKAYYVGASATQSGQLSGEIMAEYFLTHPQADRNGDGVVQYVLIKGEPGHQDAELRSQYALKPLQDAGFQLEKLQEDTGNWQRLQAQDKMAGFLAAYGERIECVIANNDDMALGAIDALKAAGYFTEGRYLPVVGVDATASAREALRQGSLLGTVFNDDVNQAKAALSLAILLAEGKPITPDTYAYPMKDNRYV